jgi:hypothetical protein
LDNKSSIKTKESYIVSKYPDIHKKIKEFISEYNLNGLTFREEIYYFINNRVDKHVCLNCSSDVKLKNTINKGYSDYCSLKCANDSGDLINKSIFYNKFDFYGINPEYRGACLPSEHILLMKNNEKLAKMAEKFEEFCFKYETQDKDNPKTVDMEAFEIGVSAFVAGYKVKDLESWGHHDLLKVGFNYNNWENIKL